MDGKEFTEEMHFLVDTALQRVRASKENLRFLPAFVQVFQEWDEEMKRLNRYEKKEGET